MTSPGARGAQQAYQQQVQHNSMRAARDAAQQGQLYARRRRGPLGPIRRLFGLVFSLVFTAVAIGVFLTILSAVEPNWWDYVTTWFDQIF
jgi:hypothetical protein